VAFFVGDAALSPGVRFPEVYAELVPKFQRALEEAGAVVVGRFQGDSPALKEDGIHWRAAVSVPPVQALVLDMLERAKPIENAAPEAGWVWRRVDADGKHYPLCVRCQKWMDAGHLESSKHKQAAGESMRLYSSSYELGALMPGAPKEISPESVLASTPTGTPASTLTGTPTSTPTASYTPSCFQLPPAAPALPTPLPQAFPQEALRRCAGCLEEKNMAAFGRAQFASAGYGGGKCLACAERDRAVEYAIYAATSALRTCQRCQQSKAEDGFGKSQFRRASYGEGTCLACAEEERAASYVQWKQER
jgi:hypothetical protein